MPAEIRPVDETVPRGWLSTLLRPKVAIPVAVALALVAAPFVFRASQVAGLSNLGEPFDLDAFGTVELAEGNNAYADYRIATSLKAPIPGSESTALDAALEKGWEHASPGVRSWVESNRPALALWKVGTQKPDALLVQPKDYQIDTVVELAAQLRDFARLARLEGMRLEGEGRPAEAWELYRSAFRSSRHSGRHGCLIERLIGIAIHAIATRDIERWSHRPDVTEAMLAEALARVQDDYDLTVPPSDTHKCEYFFLKNTFQRPDLLTAVSPVSKVSVNPSVGQLTMFVLNEPRVSELLARQIYANLLEHVDKPRSQRPPKHSATIELFEEPAGAPLPPGRLPAREISRRLERAPLAMNLLPAYASADAAVAREQALQRSLVVGLAVQIYRRRHGDSPPDLETLVSEGLLNEIPLDPFATTDEPLRYLTDKSRTAVYSVGENGSDDGGTIDRTSSRSGDVGVAFKHQEAEPVTP